MSSRRTSKKKWLLLLACFFCVALLGYFLFDENSNSPTTPAAAKIETRPSEAPQAAKTTSDSADRVLALTNPHTYLEPLSSSKFKVPATAEALTRAPADAEARVTLKNEIPISKPNERYRESFFKVEGVLWDIMSTQQFANSKSSPIGAGVGVGGLKWFGHSGLEGDFRAQAANLNQNNTSIVDLEARYHYRFHFNGPTNWISQVQVSFFAGYEFYKNSNPDFTPTYNLIEVGSALEFPVITHWSAGGEFVYGQGFDASQKYGIGGHVKYHFNQIWSLTLGYKANFFQAGSSSSAPYGLLPYREGDTETFTSLEYHF